MGKYIKAITLLFCLLFATNAGSVSPVILHGVSGGSGSPADYSDILLWDRMEAAAQNGTYDYPGDTTWQLGSTTMAAGGRVNNGLIAPDSGSNGDDWAREPIVNNDLASSTEGTIYVEFKLTNWVNNAKFFAVLDESSGYSIHLQASGTDEIQLGWGENGLLDAVTTTDCNLSTGTWYLAEVNYQASSNYRKIAVYNTSGSEICSTTDSSTAISGFTIDAGWVYMGNPDTTAQFVFALDNARISNIYNRNFVTLRDIDDYPG